MPALCAARIFQLTRELGHKSDGETIQWLLHQSEPSIVAATGSGTIPASFLAAAGASPVSEQGSSFSLGLHHLPGNNNHHWTGMNAHLTKSPGLWPAPTGYGPGLLVHDSPAAAGPSASNNNNNNNMGGEGSAFVPRFGFHGFELPNVNNSYSAFLSGNDDQLPGLELGLSADGHVGMLNSQALTQIYHHQQQQQQQQSSGSSLGHQQQQQQRQAVSDDKDDSLDSI